MSGKELEVVETTPVAQPVQTNMVFMAMERGLTDPAIIEKMMEMQERHEKNEARKAYTQAMSAFKANPPRIAKDKHVEFKTSKGTTSYNHASLGNVTGSVSSELGKHGLSASWDTKQDGTQITVTCKITHALGHCESTSLTAQPDSSGTKNPIQSVGSAVSYLQRYTLLALTGLATHDQDNDAQQPIETLSEKQISEVVSMLDEKNIQHSRILNWLKCDSWENVPAFRYEVIVKEIKNAKAGA